MKKINLSMTNKKNGLKNFFITENNNDKKIILNNINNNNNNNRNSLFNRQNFSDIQTTNSNTIIKNNNNYDSNISINSELPNIITKKNSIENYNYKNKNISNNNIINNDKKVLSQKQLILNQFNKLYGLPSDFESKYKKVKHSRNISLENYQKNLLLISTNLTKESAMKLHNSFRKIKELTEETKPLPKFNYDALYEHSLKEAYLERIKKNKKLLNALKYLKHREKKDFFEIEQEKILKNKHKIVHKENPRLLQLYKILPIHVVNAVFMKREKN
jgi:hypothetical protein